MVDRAPETASLPIVSVLVCTRNRRGNVVATIRSVQDCGFPSFEMWILDQSDDGSTQDAVAKACAEDARIHHLRLARPGKPIALNEGLRRANGRFVLLTDDDCEVMPGWITAIVEALEADSSIGCVYGSVEAAPHDAAQGYIPASVITSAHTISSLSEFLTMPGWENYGMGANMSFRVDAIQALGGWDDCIGPGTKFGSGDDNDMAVRVLNAGHRIGFCPSARVIHYGFRRWTSTRRDLARRGFGMGSVVAKHLRSGVVFSGGLRAFNHEARQCLVRLAHLERPRNVTFLAGWLRGFFVGLRHPIDTGRGRFIPDEDTAADHHQGNVAEVVLRAEVGDDSKR